MSIPKLKSIRIYMKNPRSSGESSRYHFQLAENWPVVALHSSSKRYQKKADCVERRSRIGRNLVASVQGPLRSLGPITPLSSVSRRFLVYILIDSGVLHRRYPIMVALREDRMHREVAASGIWITILYGVYLYGEKCSGITVRSLRSAVPAGSKKPIARVEEESRDRVRVRNHRY
ncbi:hypothetical protein K0M31_002703 [Melipona bicolor]|uniref:Uncharacterized protein n=1 Tax=Melipona bicolor TaxID=60889 RepID=A0AA40KPV9_9HYME|nr:hypothetical protein K0M31_002703 [Melipona bicolor]